MKRLLLILILTLSFQSWTKADDIGDFEIEGMSIGDSALKYYNLKELKKYDRNYVKDKSFLIAEIIDLDSDNYDGLQIIYESKNKIIHGINGIVDCRNDFIICENKFNEVSQDLSNFFRNQIIKSKKKISNHRADKSGKSKNTKVVFDFINGDQISLLMTNWSNAMGHWDNLKLQMGTSELVYWYENKAYK